MKCKKCKNKMIPLEDYDGRIVVVAYYCNTEKCEKYLDVIEAKK